MNIKKNLLDLEYQKYLQFYIATIIILFTYFIGLGIAFLTKQINKEDYLQIGSVFMLSIIIIGIANILISKFNSNLKRITEEIKILK